MNRWQRHSKFGKQRVSNQISYLENLIHKLYAEKRLVSERGLWYEDNSSQKIKWKVNKV